MSRWRLSPEAQGDLTNIKEFLVSAGGPSLARHVLGGIRIALKLLAANPGEGRSREDHTDEPVKFWSVLSYLIVYDPAMKPLGVARVLHGSQDLETIFRSRPPRV